MRHLRMVGLALVAVLATTALVATSASALPEFGQCYVQAKHEGKYANAGCTVKAKKVSEKFTGEFEWRKETAVTESKAFHGEGGAGILIGEYKICEPIEKRAQKCAEGEEEKVLLEKPLSVECTKENNFGELSGTKEVKSVSVRFKGCKLLGAVPCSNTPAEGEIAVNPLKGKLGYIHKATKEVGIQLEPATKKGAFATFSCNLGETPLTTVVGVGNEKEGCAYPLPACGGDTIISPVTPINTMGTKLTQVYTVNEKFENVPNKFEGKPLDVLESYIFNATEPQRTTKWSKAGESITNVNTSESEQEIKA
jgi:hypothetical protein